jgi:hypothetical protein
MLPKVARGGREWHTHLGWFDYMEDQRRLNQVNIDVVQAQILPDMSQPSVGIYTMIQDEAPHERMVQFESVDVLHRLDDIHVTLKSRLAELLLPSVKRQIGLET